MANTFSFLPKPKGAVAPGSSTSTSATTYSNPTLANTLANQGASNVTNASGSLLDYLGNPTNSSAYKTTLSGMLADLQPSINEGYQNLSDQFRKAGAQQSGAYGTALSQYATGVERNQAGLAADALKATMAPTIQGYSGLAQQAPSLIDALKLSQSNSASQAYDPAAAAAAAKVDPNAGVRQGEGFSSGTLRYKTSY